MQNEVVTYEADGLMMKSQLFFEPATQPRAGVLIFPEAFGLGAHVISRAKRLAGLGYVALACDVHGDGLLIADLSEAMERLQPIYTDTSRMRARARGALDALSKRQEVNPSKVASIGYYLGGTMSLELARSGADIKAVAGFHSGLATTAPKSDAKAIRARILVCIGADDPFISAQERAAFESEMRDAGVDWQMHVYGGTVHSFTNVEADGRGKLNEMRYSAASDARSWAAMQSLFGETLA